MPLPVDPRQAPIWPVARDGEVRTANEWAWMMVRQDEYDARAAARGWTGASSAARASGGAFADHLAIAREIDALPIAQGGYGGIRALLFPPQEAP